MPEWFQLGGFGMWFVLAFGAGMTGASIRYGLRPLPRFVPLLLTFGVLTVASGAFGFVTGLIATVHHLEGVAVADRLPVFIVGFGESLHNVAFALGLVLVAALATTTGVWRSARAPAGE